MTTPGLNKAAVCAQLYQLPAPRRARGDRSALVSVGSALLLIIFLLLCRVGAAQAVVVGSKNFTESYLLAEIMAQLLEHDGFSVQRRFGLAGTLVCYQALVNSEIDVYPEYTGTISSTLLKTDPKTDLATIGEGLSELGLQSFAPLGFNNSYAIAIRQDTAKKLKLRKISDLQQQPQLVFGFSHEFRDRADGWPGLSVAYGLDRVTRGIEHGLAYRAIAEGQIEVTDAYTTDGDIARYKLVLLDDDQEFFPRYDALLLANTTLDPGARASLLQLTGRIDDPRMRSLNARVVVDNIDVAVVAAEFLAQEGLAQTNLAGADSSAQRLWRNTLRHLQLTSIALLLACLVGVPTGIAIHQSKSLTRVVLYVAGLLQTIPSIALLALMIPLLGVGFAPAIVALFLYSLLPVLRNTTTALNSIDPVLRRVAVGMGLNRLQQIRHVVLPLASPNVLAGIRTAAVISIGTATLAAFIGAGGLGEPIVTGLALNDSSLILQGAIPAAILALTTELLFEALERWLIPAHLRRNNLNN